MPRSGAGSMLVSPQFLIRRPEGAIFGFDQALSGNAVGFVFNGLFEGVEERKCKSDDHDCDDNRANNVHINCPSFIFIKIIQL